MYMIFVLSFYVLLIQFILRRYEKTCDSSNSHTSPREWFLKLVCICQLFIYLKILI